MAGSVTQKLLKPKNQQGSISRKKPATEVSIFQSTQVASTNADVDGQAIGNKKGALAHGRVYGKWQINGRGRRPMIGQHTMWLDVLKPDEKKQLKATRQIINA